MDKKKILVTFIESGFGHITSAKAISDSLKEQYGEKYNIIDCNIMKDSEKTVTFEKFLTKQTKATNKIHGYGFFIFTILEAFGGAKFLRFTHSTFFHSYVQATIEAFEKYKPDVIVSTHYFITYCAVEYKRKVDNNCLIVTYNPDNNVHPWWDNRDGIFITNNIYATEEAVEKRKFKSENCKTVNFACRTDLLECNESKEFYREKYGIDKDTFCVIVADGGYALGKCKAVTNELLKTNKKITIIAVAGKNEKVYNYFLNKNPKENISFMSLPFVKNIYELYRAADLFITKAGPNAVSDCVFMNTPILIDYYPHPIEKATKKLFVDKFRCGEYIKSPRKIRKRVEELIENPHILDEYVKNTYNFKKECNGASEIACIIDEALTQKEKDEN